MLELMKIFPWQTQQMSPMYLFMTTTFSWKLLVVMHNVSTERIDYTTELFITWLENSLLTVINMDKNGDVQHRHQ